MGDIHFLLYPFLGCVLLILIHGYFGIHILERGVIFSDLSMAQFIALGASISFFMDSGPWGQQLYPIIFAIIGAAIMSLSRQIARFVNIEAFIGVLYIFSLAVSILLLDRTPHGLEELKAILNGNIIWITGKDLFQMLALYSCIGAVHLLFRERFFALSYEGKEDYLWEFLFFLSFAFVLVSSVAIAGILQVFSFLVIPALIGRLFSTRPFTTLVIGWVTGLMASVFGLIVSYKMDLPTAPLFVAFLSVIFFILLTLKAWRAR